MKRYYLLLATVALLILGTYACSQDEGSDYSEVNSKATNPVGSPIKIDFSLVPYPKLSDYQLFVGPLKDHKPNYMVIPYKPASSLFTDYAHKKRFIWLPKGTKASYNGADNVLEFPVGTVISKTFYYDHVQPNDVTKLIETRLLVRKVDGWKLYDYIWNEEQTEAYLDTNQNGYFVPITWTDDHGVTRSITYKIPSQTECVTCHKINPLQVEGGERNTPIGPKPQNLNTMYNYGNATRNQLQYWKNIGYINNTLPALSAIHSAVDWEDTTQPLELRARSYIDINCAHCHRTGGHCAYVPQRFDLANNDLYTFGVCLPPLFTIPNQPYVINGRDPDHSEIIYRMNTNAAAEMMPMIGRSIVHDEGVQLMRDYINSLQGCH